MPVATTRGVVKEAQPVYRCEVRVISRKGRTTVRTPAATLAYRTHTALKDEHGQVHDYTRKRNLIARGIVADDDAPTWTRDLQAIADANAAANKRKDAQLGRELLLTVDVRVPPQAAAKMVADFLREHVARDGRVVVWSLENPPRRVKRVGAGEPERNPHVHATWDDRPAEAVGFGKKIRQTEDERAAEIARIREAWAAVQNAAIKAAGRVADLDHRAKVRTAGDVPEPKLGASLGRFQRNQAKGTPQDPRDVERLRQVAAIRKRREASRQATQVKQTQPVERTPAPVQQPQTVPVKAVAPPPAHMPTGQRAAGPSPAIQGRAPGPASLAGGAGQPHGHVDSRPPVQQPEPERSRTPAPRKPRTVEQEGWRREVRRYADKPDHVNLARLAWASARLFRKRLEAEGKRLALRVSRLLGIKPPGDGAQTVSRPKEPRGGEGRGGRDAR